MQLTSLAHHFLYKMIPKWWAREVDFIRKWWAREVHLTGTLWWDFNICSTKFFFDLFLAFGAFRHHITVRLGHPQGYQTPNWPQHSHFPESGIFQVILSEIGKNAVLACGLWIFWASHVWIGKKICLRVSNTYSQWLVPRNVKKTVFKTPFRNWGL